METLRNEHTRVFMQDQALLRTIKESKPGAGSAENQGREMKSAMAGEGKVKQGSELGANQREKLYSHEGVRNQGQQEAILDKDRALQKRKDPIYQLKPLSIVEENMAYEYHELEENLTKFLLEKVIVMREVPFMRATDKLERNKNINKIYDQLVKLAASNQFASKQNQEKFLIAQRNRGDLKPTQAYEGGLGAPSGSAEPETFKQHGAGRATFKVKQEAEKSPKEEVDSKKPAQPGKMLQNEEIREICEKHALSRKEVYQIRSEFASMCDDSEKMRAELESGVGEDGLPESQNKGRRNAQGGAEGSTLVGEKPLGIAVDYFIKYSQFLSGAIPEISKRILYAAGLDVESAGAQIGW